MKNEPTVITEMDIYGQLDRIARYLFLIPCTGMIHQPGSCLSNQKIPHTFAFTDVNVGECCHSCAAYWCVESALASLDLGMWMSALRLFADADRYWNNWEDRGFRNVPLRLVIEARFERHHAEILG